jgi:hypothetical protein
MLTRTMESEKQYLRVSLAAVKLRVDSSAIYRLLQKGVLDGTFDEAVNRWLVDAASVERLRVSRESARSAIHAANVA